MELSKEAILQHLRHVIDPEVNLNIVDMGLVYGIAIEGHNVTVTMTLTTQGCPMRSYMENAVHESLSEAEGIEEVIVDIVWSPPWSPDLIDRAALARLHQGEI